MKMEIRKCKDLKLIAIDFSEKTSSFHWVLTYRSIEEAKIVFNALNSHVGDKKYNLARILGVICDNDDFLHDCKFNRFKNLIEIVYVKGSYSSKHPSYYTYYINKKYEPRKVISDWGLNFNLGNALKYISRAGLKTKNPKENIEKAITYLQFELEELENGEEKTDAKD